MPDSDRYPTDQPATSLNISLPADMKSFVEGEVAREHYGSTSEFIRDLIRRFQRERAKEVLERKLLEALDSGKPLDITPEFWEKKRRELGARQKPKRGKAR